MEPKNQDQKTIETKADLKVDLFKYCAFNHGKNGCTRTGCPKLHHPIIQGKIKTPCRFYFRRTCNRGDACIYVHSESQDVLCRYANTCRKASAGKCQFKHLAVWTQKQIPMEEQLKSKDARIIALETQSEALEKKLKEAHKWIRAAKKQAKDAKDAKVSKAKPPGAKETSQTVGEVKGAGTAHAAPQPDDAEDGASPRKKLRVEEKLLRRRSPTKRKTPYNRFKGITLPTEEAQEMLANPVFILNALETGNQKGMFFKDVVASDKKISDTNHVQFLSQCLAESDTAVAMLIECLDAVVRVLGQKLSIQSVPTKEAEDFLKPLKSANRDTNFAFWGGLILLSVMINGLGKTGLYAIKWLIDVIFTEVELDEMCRED